MPYQGRYRFRDWPDRRSNQIPHHASPARAKVARSISYWGGNPVHQRQPVPESTHYSAMGYPDQTTGFNTAYQPGEVAYSSQRYRFRPMQDRMPVEPRASTQYRPMQVEIPQHYRFRPLQSVAQNRPRPAREYRSHQMRWRPFNAAVQPPRQYGHVAPWPRHRYAYNYPGRMEWRPYDNGRRVMAPYPSIPSPAAMPSYVWRGPAHPMGPQFSSRQRHYPPANRRFRQPPRPYWTYRPIPYPTNPYVGAPRIAHYPAPLARPEWQRQANRSSGTDWYDGRHDGEGAWYQLAKSSMPAVSQRWDDPGSEILPAE
jgi:hypothetical protein